MENLIGLLDEVQPLVDSVKSLVEIHNTIEADLRKTHEDEKDFFNSMTFYEKIQLGYFDHIAEQLADVHVKPRYRGMLNLLHTTSERLVARFKGSTSLDESIIRITGRVSMTNFATDPTWFIHKHPDLLKYVNIDSHQLSVLAGLSTGEAGAMANRIQVYRKKHRQPDFGLWTKSK